MELTRREFSEKFKPYFVKEIEKDFNGIIKIKDFEIEDIDPNNSGLLHTIVNLEINFSIYSYGEQMRIRFLYYFDPEESFEFDKERFYSMINFEWFFESILKKFDRCELNNMNVKDYRFILDYLKVDTSDLSDEEIELFIETRKYFKDDYYRELIHSFTNLHLPDEICFLYRSKKQVKRSIRKIKLTAYIIKKLTQEQKEILDLNFLY